MRLSSIVPSRHRSARRRANQLRQGQVAAAAPMRRARPAVGLPVRLMRGSDVFSSLRSTPCRRSAIVGMLLRARLWAGLLPSRPMLAALAAVVFSMRRPQIAALPRGVIVPLPFGSSRQARRARAGVRLARRFAARAQPGHAQGRAKTCTILPGILSKGRNGRDEERVSQRCSMGRR